MKRFRKFITLVSLILLCFNAAWGQQNVITLRVVPNQKIYFKINTTNSGTTNSFTITDGMLPQTYTTVNGTASFEYTPTQATVTIFSKYIQRFDLNDSRNSSVKYVNVSNCSSLVYLTLQKLTVDSVTIKDLPNLVTMSMDDVNYGYPLQLTSLPKVKTLWMSGSTGLFTIDLNALPSLETFHARNCGLNNIIINNANLKEVYLHGNNFTTQIWNNILCTLPLRDANDRGTFAAVNNLKDPTLVSFVEANGNIAIQKNWNIVYTETSSPINTRGTYTCSDKVNFNYFVEIVVDNYNGSASGNYRDFTYKMSSVDQSCYIVVQTNGLTSNESAVTQMGTDLILNNLDASFWYGGSIFYYDQYPYTKGYDTIRIYGKIDKLGFASHENARLISFNTRYNPFLNTIALAGFESVDIDKFDISSLTLLNDFTILHSNLSTTDFDKLMCKMPATTNGTFRPIITLNNNDDDYSNFMRSNSSIVKAKGWTPKTYATDIAIPQTTGVHNCVDLNTYIKLGVIRGEMLSFGVSFENTNEPIRIISGDWDTAFICSSYDMSFKLRAKTDSLIIYANCISFTCSNNKQSLYSLDVSHNTNLQEIYCQENNLELFDISNLTKLRTLVFYNNSPLITVNQYNEFFCKMPATTNGVFIPIQLLTNTSVSRDTLSKTNTSILTAKGWNVIDNSGNIVNYSSDYRCPLTTNNYVKITTKKGVPLHFRIGLMFAQVDNRVRIISGALDSTIVIPNSTQTSETYYVGTAWDHQGDFYTFVPQDSIITLWGDFAHLIIREVAEEGGIYNSEFDESSYDIITAIDLHSDILTKFCMNNVNKLKGENFKMYCPEMLVLNIAGQKGLGTLTLPYIPKCGTINIGNCELNDIDLSSSNISGTIHMYGNNFSTSVWDKIICDITPWGKGGVVFAVGAEDVGPDGNNRYNPYPLTERGVNFLNANVAKLKTKWWTSCNTGANIYPDPYTGSFDCDYHTNNQEYNPHNIIKLKVTKNKHMYLILRGNRALDSTWIRITSNSLDTFVRLDNSSKWIDLGTTKDTIYTVSGDVGHFSTNNSDDDAVRAIEVKDHSELRTIAPAGQALRSITLDNCPQFEQLHNSYTNEGKALEVINITNCPRLHTLNVPDKKIHTLNVKNASPSKIDLQNNQLTSISYDENFFKYANPLLIGGNNFSTAAYDSMMCAFGDNNHVISPKPTFCPVNTLQDSLRFTQANASIATAKGWKIAKGSYVYGMTYEYDPQTVGTFNCDYINLENCIKVVVKKGAAIKLGVCGKEDSLYRIVNGTSIYNRTAACDPSSSHPSQSWNLTAQTDTLYVYGNIYAINLSSNGNNVTGIISENSHPTLGVITCSADSIAQLDLDMFPKLCSLYCNYTQITSLTLPASLKFCRAYRNNSLTSIDVSKCTQLEYLDVEGNKLTNLDISNCQSLQTLYCYHNNLSTDVLNKILCSLPDRNGKNRGYFNIVGTETTRPQYSAAKAANGSIGIAKNYSSNVASSFYEGTYRCYEEQVNMNKYVTLVGVQPGDIIQLDLRAENYNIPVLITNGNSNIFYSVSAKWVNKVGSFNIAIDSFSTDNTVTIYGDIDAVNCSGNTSITKALLANNPDLQVFNCSGTSIKSLNVSQNPKLMDIVIADCPFTTQSYNDMMCGICPKPANQAYAYIRPFRTNTNTTLDPCYQRFVEANVMNAMSKGWSVATIDEGVQPNFTSGIPYPCPVLDTTTSVSLTVTQGKWIKLDFSADSAFTVVSVVSGGYDTTFTLVNPNQSTPLYFYADATTMTIYGKIATLDCSNNGDKITGLNVSKNTRLTSLNCGRNKLTSLTLGNNAKLTYLNCYTNDLTSLNISNLPNLDSLYCSQNRLTSLDISNNTKLKLCNAMDNQIATLTVGQNTALEQLYCYGNKLTTLDVSTLTSLVKLRCHTNELKTLDVSKNLALEDLICSRNKITTLNLGANTVLKDLRCVNNRLQSLSVTLNTALCTLMCDSNYLLDLDISRNTALKYISCGNNQFTTESYNQMMCNIVSVPGSENCRFLPVYNTTTTNADYKAFMAANANIAKNKGWKVGFGSSINTNITTTGTYTCPTVNTSSYIQMDVVQEETIKFKLMAPSSIQVRVLSGALDTFVFATTGWSKVINITAGAPNIQIYGDVNGLDCGGNYENISDINVSHNRSICTLYCDRNNLTSLDVSNCLSLTDLYCFQNKIHDLNLANTPALKRLRCNDDSLTGLDLSSCFSLEYLDCYSNKLSYLDISSCPNLKELRCANNKLQSLDLTDAQALTSLDCEYNELTSLDVNTCASLEQLICRNNHIATLNVSLCTTLVDLDCSNNALTELDMNGCSSLNALSCQQNQLKFINVNNSKSINYLVCFENRFTTADFDNLMCGLPMMSKGSGNFYPLKDNKDADSSIFHLANSNIAKLKKWNVNYFNSQTAIPETEGTYICPLIDPETEVILYVKQGESVKLRMGASLPNSLIRVTSGGIDNLVTADTTFTDFQTFIADDAIVTITGLLSALDCSNNGDKITGIEIKNAHSLRYLDCSHNAISSLDLSPDATGKRSLKYLDCSFNKIASLIFYNDTLLETLLCNNNEIKDIFIDNNKYLQVINCSFNSIPSLTIKKFNFLRELYCNDNNLTLLNINSNIALETLHCFNNKLKSLNCNNNVALTDVRVYGNLFTFSKFNDIMCSLPTIVGTQATFVPLYNPSDMLAYVFGSANSNIATEKSWNVIYNDNTTIPFTTGDYICPFVNNSNVMTLKTKQGRQINLKLLADTAETYVRVSCGSLDTTFAINDTWSDAMPFYAADDDILYIYGDASGLDCSENGANISNIEVFNNANLKHLNCAKNSLTRLNVSKNKLLETLICNDNILKALDVRANTQLRTLTCYSNYFTSQAYNELMCSMPIITVGKGNFYPMYNSNNDTAFMSSNSTIASGKLWNVLYSNNTPIASTNGTYACPVIDTTSIIALNVQKNQEIKFKLNASTNNSAVNVVSGSLDTIVYVGLNSTGVISYISDADTMHIYGDVQSFDCNSNNTNILGLAVVNNATLENLVCNDNSISSLDLSTATSLVNLTCNNNNILSLDVSQSPALNTLICNNNSIATLDLTQNTSLEYLNANANRLTSLNIDFLSDLKSLHCEENNLVGLHLSTNTSLEELFCSKNNLNDLNLSQNVNLQEVYCQFNTLNTLTTGGAEALTILHCYNNLLISLDLSANTNLQEVYCYTNNLTSLNVNNDSVLRILDCSSNQLDQLNLNSNVALENLNCNINNLTSIDLSNNTALTNLSLNENQLSSLNLINNEALVEIACDNNKLNTLDVTFNIALEKLSCNDNLLTSLDVSRNRGLRYLSIYGNAFTTLNYNDVMCSMPFLGNETGTFYPLYDKNDNNYSEFIATNSTIAKNKNWTVNYADKNVTIPNTTDENYVCPANMNRYTIFDVPQGGQINFMVKGEVPNAAVMIVGVNINGKNDTTIIVDTAWTNVLNFTTLSDMVVVYGNVVGMHCEQNAENILGISVTNDVLTYLNCSDDSLYTLNVDKAPMLTYLYCANNNLSTLNVNNNPALIELDCHNNVITNLNVDENAQLTLLNCSFNNLDSLDVSPTPLLENLNCANNNISNLLVKQNLKLHTLNCANNNLEELVVVPNVELHTLDCSNNNLQDLDITNNSRLTALNCSSNQLTSLDLSYNPSIVRVACFNNLFSTQAFDDLMCSMPIVSNGIGLFFPLNDTYDNNDSLFKEANAITAMSKNWDVAYYSAFDPIYTNGTYVCPANMNNFVTMNVKQNEPIAIDVMSNLAIAPIRVISGRYDTTIYISNNWSGIINYTSEDTIMTVYGDFIALNCANNADNIIAIDASNAQITELNCESNAISSLILPQNATLESLNCASNQLLTLNLNNSSALVELNCANNTLSDLDLSQNVALEVLDCSGNNLAILDVNNNIALNTLICYNNPFTTQTYDDLMCSMPFAVNNTGNFFPLYDINDVNDTIFNNANANTANIKNWNVAYFSTNDVISTIGVWICPVDTNNFITLNVTPNEPIVFDIHSQLTTAVKIVNGSFDTIVYIGNTWYGKTSYIADMNTITIYGNVESFDCANNTEILSIDISNNTGLAYLDCSNSAQTSLDLSQNAALNVLNCANNNLSTLDINNNIALKELNCANNNLAGLTLSQNTALEVLNCTDNYLTTLDVAANNALNTLICYNNPFTTQAFDDLMCSMPTVVNNVGIFTPLFDDVDANYTQFMAANSSIALTKNWNVIYANATDVPATNGKFSCNLNMNQFITVDIAPNARINIGFTGNYFDAVVRVISGTTDTILFLDTTWTYLTFLSDDNAMIIYGDLEKFDCSNNGLSINAINVDNNTILTYLNCSSNNISNLNVANNTALNTLFTNSTQLSNLDVSKNLALTSLYCNNNNLTTLDVANNTQLEILACNNNALTSLDLSANTALNYLACYGNNFTSKDYDLLMCSMNQIDSVIGKFFPLRASSDPNYTQFMAANSNTAINKNWDVLYYSVNVNIPETRGKYDCFTGLDEVETEQITVYPNPANTTINITGVTAEHVDIYDITGRLILTVPTNGDEIVTINVSELAKGMYYIKIDNTTAKFVKQ